MIKVNQFTNLNILEHGLSVRKHFTQIITDLDSANYSRYELPDKLIQNWHLIRKQLYKQNVLSMYQIYHDCGKPFCITMGEDGKQRFPDHANVSYETFKKYFPDVKDKDIIANLIKNDMVFHSGTMEQIGAFIATEDKKTVFTLWMTSLAELYANKEMFDSDNQLSFKIKYKKLLRVLNKLI